MARGRGQEGQATVEFALILPLIVLVALMVVQVGLVLKDVALTQHAAREAARAAAVEPDTGVARHAAARSSTLDPSRLSVGLTGGTDRGDFVTAVVAYRSPTTVPLVGRLVGDIDLRAAVTMRVE